MRTAMPKWKHRWGRGQLYRRSYQWAWQRKSTYGRCYDLKNSNRGQGRAHFIHKIIISLLLHNVIIQHPLYNPALAITALTMFKCSWNIAQSAWRKHRGSWTSAPFHAEVKIMVVCDCLRLESTTPCIPMPPISCWWSKHFLIKNAWHVSSSSDADQCLACPKWSLWWRSEIKYWICVRKGILCWHFLSALFSNSKHAAWIYSLVWTLNALELRSAGLFLTNSFCLIVIVWQTILT